MTRERVAESPWFIIVMQARGVSGIVVFGGSSSTRRPQDSLLSSIQAEGVKYGGYWREELHTSGVIIIFHSSSGGSEVLEGELQKFCVL